MRHWLRNMLNGGLVLPVVSPPFAAGIEQRITAEAALTAPGWTDLRVDPLVEEGAVVAQGAPVLRNRRHPQIQLCAPMAGRLAALSLGPGRRLERALFFHEAQAGRHVHDTGLPPRALMQAAGLWRAFRARPFGRVPLPDAVPAGIFVMACDTRPLAAAPRLALEGQQEDFARGLHALAGMTKGPVWLAQDDGPDLAVPDLAGTGARLRILRPGPLHPAGLAGVQIVTHQPARLDAPVWDIAAEDVAALGALIATGMLPETRLIAVAGPALREARLMRAQPGADLRGLTHGLVRPGPHAILSGSALEGAEAQFLRPRDRQVTVLTRPPAPARAHWFRAALGAAARPVPLIPTAALDHALGRVVPASALLRAIASGDEETATRLGALSLLPEDLTLADYVTCAEPALSALLGGLLARIEAEEAGP